MTHDKTSRFDARLTRAAEAKQAALQKFKERQAANGPEAQARQEERMKIQEARAIREAERAKARAEADELAAKAAVENAENARLQAELDAAKAIELAAEQKAQRDARYAARKARSK